MIMALNVGQAHGWLRRKEDMAMWCNLLGTLGVAGGVIRVQGLGTPRRDTSCSPVLYLHHLVLLLQDVQAVELLSKVTVGCLQTEVFVQVNAIVSLQ